MGVFILSPTQEIAVKLRDYLQAPGFVYQSRSHMEMLLLKHLSDIGTDIWPTAHFILGSLAGSLDYHLALNPDDPVERQAQKLCEAKTAWSYVKLRNGPRMNFVLGYSSCDAANPFAMSPSQMAQKGIIQSTFIPG
jgi:hypothetical protein